MPTPFQTNSVYPREANDYASLLGSLTYHREGNHVDFIERLFGVSPDDGSGLLEVLLFLVPMLGKTDLQRLNSADRGNDWLDASASVNGCSREKRCRLV